MPTYARELSLSSSDQTVPTTSTERRALRNTTDRRHYAPRHKWEPGETKTRYADGTLKPRQPLAKMRQGPNPVCRCGCNKNYHDIFGCPSCEWCTVYVSRDDNTPYNRSRGLLPPVGEVTVDKAVQVRDMLLSRGFGDYSHVDGQAICKHCMQLVTVGKAYEVYSERIMLAAHQHTQKCWHTRAQRTV